MARRFNITGPCVPGRDFMVDLSARLKRPLQAIGRGESLLLVRARQSGKTTLLRELAAALRRQNLAVALCAMQVAEDQTLTGLFRHIEATLHKAYPLPALPKWVPTEPQSLSFCAWLGEAQQKLGRPLVLILDEYDAPPRKLVLSMLRSFRSALALADESRPFVHSLTLCGKTHVRDLRDELRPSGDESRGSGSLWNIALPLPLSSLSRAEVDALLDQYTADSGVPWRREAREELWHKTHGQPWLVCRIAYELDEQLGCPRLEPAPPDAEPPSSREGAGPPSVATVRAAAAQLLEEDCVHLLSVSDLLLGRRDAQELVLRLLDGEELPLCRANEAQSYLLDTGVILPSESGRFIELHNPIYESYLGRWLPEQR
ncbi:MAG TPA: ATP-binding protein [Pseudomonadota bacterium]|nr:ATP-binding protein [Pseudomonadota bacterium]